MRVFLLYFIYLFIVCIYASNCCLPFVNAMMLLGLCLNWRSKTIEAKQILKLIVGAPCLLVLYSSSERLQSVSLCLCLRCWRCCRVVFGSHGWHGIPNVHTEEADHPTNRPTNRPPAMQSQTSNHIKQIFVVFSRIFSLIVVSCCYCWYLLTYYRISNVVRLSSSNACRCNVSMYVCFYKSIKRGNHKKQTNKLFWNGLQQISASCEENENETCFRDGIVCDQPIGQPGQPAVAFGTDRPSIPTFLFSLRF